MNEEQKQLLENWPEILAKLSFKEMDTNISQGLHITDLITKLLSAARADQREIDAKISSTHNYYKKDECGQSGYGEHCCGLIGSAISQKILNQDSK